MSTLKNMTDNEILRLSYQSPKAFAELFDRHYKRLMFVAKKTLGSGDEAEDIVQETFVRVYKYGKKFVDNDKDKEADFRHWSNAILKNCMIDRLRKRQKREVTLTDELESVLESPNESLERESEDYTHSVLRKLGKASAQILNLRFVLGKSFKEIGKALGMSSGAARVKAYRAKKEFVKIHKELSIKYE